MPVAVVVVTTAMAPEAAMNVPVTVVVMMTMVTVTATVMTATVMTAGTTATVMAATVMAATGMAATVMATTVVTATMTAAAVATRLSTGGDERRQADDGRGDESEKCSTFEHYERPYWLEVNHPASSRDCCAPGSSA
jgi:hypothetical protein